MDALKIAVLGAHGRLGKEFVSRIALPNIVIPFSHLAVDVTEYSRLNVVLDRYKPDVIINCAAANGLEFCNDNPELAAAVNTLAPLTMAKWCEKNKALFIHFSTDYATSSNTNVSMYEDNIGEPIGVYGATKRAGEILVLETSSESLVFRISSLYGPDLAGSLSPVRDFKPHSATLLKVIPQMTVPISTRRVAEVVIDIFTRYRWLVPGLFNLTNIGPVTKRDFALKAIDLVHLTDASDLVIEAEDLPIKRPRFSVLDSIKLNKTFGIAPKFVYDDLEDSLKAWGLLPCSTASQLVK